MAIRVQHTGGALNMWYVYDNTGRGYLHQDGTWHQGTSDNSGNYSGLFRYEAAARMALALATSPIKLTASNWWQELEQLHTTRSMPAHLVDCLKELVSSHLHSMIGPEATPRLIALAKNYLDSGILLSDSAGDYLYDVMVWVPNPDKVEYKRSFFRLVPKWSDGRLKYLYEIEEDIEEEIQD